MSEELERKVSKAQADLRRDIYLASSPEESPLFKVWHFARVQKRKTGGSMRQRRRAMMKPMRFTPCDKVRKVYEWRRDA